MFNLKLLFNTLSNIGIDKVNEESQSISATNIGVLITWIISLPYVLAFYYLNFDYLFIVNASMEILYPTVLLFNKYHHYFGAKNWFMTLGYLHVSLISVHLGEMSGAELYFYLLPIISVFIYSRKEKSFMVSTVFLFFFFYTLTQYLYTIIEPNNIEPEILKILYYSSYGVVLFFIVAFFYFFKISSLRYQDNLDEEKKFTQTLIDSQEQLIITTDGTTLVSANKTFFDFFLVESVEDFKQKYNYNCISNTFSTKVPQGYLQRNMENSRWIDYIISHSTSSNHKVMIKQDGTDFIFSVTAAEIFGDKAIKLAVFTNITEIENAKIEIEMIHKHTRESIEYASLLQAALIPKDKLFEAYFQDYFTLWQPRDTVGGDIYLFEALRSKDECLLMVIDCTGHGVPGAFVTMLVKAVERQITSQIKYSDDTVSPAKILTIFNQNMKQLLKQESGNSISNAGFDGGILYYNKKEKIIKYAGAETPLFYIQEDTLEMIKGDRYSVGYKKCKMDYEYTEHTLQAKEGMQLYLTTDGYLDQNGGTKGFSLGKKRFKKLLSDYHNKPMLEQKELFLNTFNQYKNNQEVNDDVTIIGLQV